MNNCSVDLQRRIITAMEEAVFTLPGQPTVADVEEYIGLKISKKFTFKSVRDNIPIRTAFKEIFGDVDLSDSGGSALHYSNIIKNVRSYSIDDLFHGLPAAKVEFEGYSTRLLVGEGILGRNNKSSYAFSDNDLNNNFKDLKNNLFEKIQKFLTKKNKYRGKISPLFDKDGVVDYNHYVNIMNILDQYFFNNLEMPTITSYTGKKVPELSYNFNTNRDIFEAYYDMIILTNFDSIINSKFSKYFKVNINKMNLLDLDTGDNLKYTLVFDPTTSLYWSKEDHESDSSEGRTDWFTKSLVTLIPQYNRQGEKTPNYMEVNDFYLLAAKFAEFELLEGNRLKNDENNEYGFDYFNNNSVERFQWYLENIKKSVNKEIGSLPSLATYFGDVYDKILSIDNFINDSEYNIAEKERNSGNSLITFMTQVINNNFGSSYSIYNTDGTYTTQEMYQQDFNSTRVQSSLFSAMKINYMDKSFYDLTDAKELKRFNDLFPSNLENISNMVEAIESKAVDYIKINKYIKDKTGIPMTRNSLISAIRDMSMNIYDGNPVTGYNFRLDLEKLITYGLNKDFNSDSFKESVEQSSGRNVNFDSTIKDVIPESIKQPLFIALKNAYLENFTIKAVMNVNTSKDTTLPTFKVGNLTYKDTELFDLRRQYEKETTGLLFNSLLIKDDPAIVGTSTKLEVVGAKRSKMYDELTPIEQFTSDFKYDFIANAVNNNKFSVIIGNYSDKSTILAKVINGDFILDKEGRNVTILKEDIDNILETVRVQGYSFYSDTLTTVFNDYKEVFDALKIKHNITPDNLNALNTNVSEVNRILTSLTTKERSPIIELNSRLSELPADSKIEVALTEELHYSRYADGTFLNNFLIDNFIIFKDSDKKNGLFYNDFVKQNERKFLEKFSNNTGNSEINLGLDTKKIDKVLTTFNLTSKDFEDSNKKTNYNSVTLSEGKLNPLIRKWMWTNALFRNEYLFISTKGEYMHPHKQRGLSSRFGKTMDSDYKDSYFSEMSGRLSSMAKRNVTNTASVELPVRHSKRGVPDDINLASIEDFKSNIYTTSGYSKKGQDAHDGSSFLDYTYSKMLDESFPGKGYSGTKKQFGTLITPNGVTIKKDAESVITNNKIRTSGEISFLTKKRQMLGIPIGNEALEYSSGSLAEYYIIKNGERQKVNSIKIFNKEGKNFVTLNYSPRKKSSDGTFTYGKAVDLAPVEVDSLFDIWQVIGAEFSVDADGNFNEESNERLYDIIINTNDGILKNKMIHILSNHSALKAGAAGLNGRHLWTEDGSLLYSTYKSRFMGPQLDASHEADNSEIKEVSQVISALSQGGFTSDLANEVYSDIARIIKQSMDKYVKLLKPGKEDREKLYRILSNKFISSIRRSDREEVTKAIIDSLLANNVKIPFSNQNFYNLFVREIVTTLNNEFISRHYSGMGGVLIPSHGIFQVYDVYQPEIVSESGEIIEPAKWVVKTKEDLYKEALDRYSFEGGDPLSNDQIVNNYINEVLPDYRTTVDKIELGDTVKVYGQIETLDTAEKYYRFKDKFKSNPSITAFKVVSKARDLKPTLHTFSQNITLYDLNNEPYVWESTKNTFDLQPLQLLYKSELNILNEEETAIINNLNNYLDSIGNPADTETFLRSWLQRDLELLEHNLVMRDISPDESFADFFKNDNVLRDVISDVIDSYTFDNMSTRIHNLSFRAAEISMGDIYKTKFGKEDLTSMSHIKSKGYEYFADKLNDLYDTTDETEADIKIITDDISTPIYIKFVNSNSGGNEVNLRLDPDVDYDLVARYDELGNRLYTIPDPNNTRIKSIGEKEIIEIKIGNLKKGNTILNKNVSAIQKNLKSLINSFSDVKAIIPLGKGVLDTVYNEEAKVTTEEDGSKKTNKVRTKINVESIVSNAFSDYASVPLIGIDTANKNWFKDNKKLILNRIAKTTYASWEKSHDVVASRIPSQSMQSFMPMKNIAYMPGGTNDVYVSIHQIFLQGSDFDIDKAYILGNGYSNRGKIDLWTNLSNYSNTDQLTALMNLPVPNQTTLTISKTSETGQIVDSELVGLYGLISQSVADKDISYELPAETISFINLFMRRLNKISKNKEHNLFLPKENADMSFEVLTNLINGHNSYEDYLNKNHAVKNSVVNNINKIISSPSNQIHANTPVTVDNLHNAANKASAKYAEYLDRKTEGNDLSSYDMMSYYQQQFNASVGKDDVGIAANGLKGLFALTSYYNNYFKNRIPTKEAENNVLKENIKPEVSELFKSNPELANEVYGALGLINVFNENKIYDSDEYNAPTIEDIKEFNLSYKKDGTKRKVYAATNNINAVLKEGFSGLNTGLGTTKGEPKGTVFLTPFLYTAADYGNMYALEGTDINDIGIIEVEINNGAGVVEGDEIRLRKEDIVSINEVKIEKNKGLVTSHQKVIAQRWYSKYLDQNPNGNIEEFKEFVIEEESTRQKRGIDVNKLRTSNKIFKKSYDFVDDFGNEIHISIGSISDVVISRAQESALKEILGPEYSKTLNNAAVLMSSFTSAATDNAKELIMAKINASTKLASMHAYMMALGFTLDQIVEFMTSETSSLIINESTDNIYYDESPKSITGVIDRLKKDTNINQSQLQVFEAIYKDSKEFTSLTGFLGINQKRKADTWEMYNYLNRFTKTISDAESTILKEYKKNVADLKKSNEAADKEVTITNLGDLDFDTFFDVIINDKPYLSNDREYVKNIYDEVQSYVLKDDTPRKGETVKISGDFDLNLYLSDSGYQAVVKKYYNLLKRTFNIFDIVEDVPHFKEMINSLKMSNHMLQTMTAKYKFTTKTLAETIKKHSHALDKNGETKYVGKKNLLRGSNYFDIKTIETWLKTDRMSKFTFNVGSLLKQANINEIVLFTSDSAINNPDQVEVVDQNSDFTISLDTNYGIANFKRVMEQVILPLLQSYDNSNMTENLRVETVNNLFGLKTNSIISAYSLKALNSPVAIHQFNSLLSAFNSLDSNIQTEGKIKNSYGEELKWRDLFYIYNLTVNNERYGDKRLTPLFRDYTKEKDSLSLDYIEFYSKVDSGDVDIFYYDLYNSPEYNDESVDNLVENQKELKDKYEEALIRDMLIYAFQERGVLDEAGTETTIINNSDFVIATNIQGKYDSSFVKMREILRKINLGGFVIEFKC